MRAGDHLVSPRTGYTHHGIYVGNEEVIHYSGFASGMSKGAISVTSLTEFACGHDVSVKDYRVRCYDHDQTAERAYTRLGEDWYNVVANNCEHFATWCVQGVHASAQVNTLIEEAAETYVVLAAAFKAHHPRRTTLFDMGGGDWVAQRPPLLRIDELPPISAGARELIEEVLRTNSPILAMFSSVSVGRDGAIDRGRLVRGVGDAAAREVVSKLVAEAGRRKGTDTAVSLALSHGICTSASSATASVVAGAAAGSSSSVAGAVGAIGGTALGASASAGLSAAGLVGGGLAATAGAPVIAIAVAGAALGWGISKLFGR